MINGVDIIFILSPIALLVAAVVASLWVLSKRGMKNALESVVRVIIYGGLPLFVLFIIWAGMYYAGGGH